MGALYLIVWISYNENATVKLLPTFLIIFYDRFLELELLNHYQKYI